MKEKRDTASSKWEKNTNPTTSRYDDDFLDDSFDDDYDSYVTDSSDDYIGY